MVVAVTGSVGKTTTKEMIYAVLSSAGPTLKTQGNLNNEIGLPKTLLELEKKHRYAVIEMGMSNLGEIARLSRTTCPNIGVVTNIGVSHLETLLTRENILRAKLEILEGMTKGSPLILNLDNDLLSTVVLKEHPVLTYGIRNPAAQFLGTQIQESGSSTTFVLQEASGKRTQVTIPCIGTHNVLNALAAFVIGLEAGLCLLYTSDGYRRFFLPAGHSGARLFLSY